VPLPTRFVSETHDAREERCTFPPGLGNARCDYRSYARNTAAERLAIGAQDACCIAAPAAQPCVGDNGGITLPVFADNIGHSEGDNWAPPMGGIGAPYFCGRGTPTLIVWAMAVRLPSPQIQWPLVRSGPSGDPLPSDPWQPAHGGRVLQQSRLLILRHRVSALT
jgi:hypothetical protein